MEIERRYAELILRAAGDAKRPVLEGEAAVFDTETNVAGYFREVIRPGAFARVLSETPDVLGVYNHDWNYVLGRTSANTLTLVETNTGLGYQIAINPNDSQAMSVFEKVKRGDVSQSSFAFTVRKESWLKPDDVDSQAIPLREILEIEKLYDVGPVPFAQYPEASASARSQSESFLSQRSRQTASDGAEALVVRQQARKRRIELVEQSIYQGDKS